MGEDPTESVVDPWGVSHDVRNLAIVDGSVFVTAGAANPTTTICALALRAVEHLLQRRFEVPVPEPARHFATPALSRPRLESAKTSLAPIVLTRDERERLAAVADAMLPGDDDMPGARVVDIAHDLLDAVVRARPDLTDDLRRALAREDGALDLHELRARDATAYRALVLVILAAYYRAPEVLTRLGDPGRTGTPVGRFEFPEYLSEGLLDHLVSPIDSFPDSRGAPT